MAAKLTRLIHKIAIQLHLVAESCTIWSSRSRRPVRKLLDTLSFTSVIWDLSRVIINDVSGYINILVRIAHIICNQLNILCTIYVRNRMHDYEGNVRRSADRVLWSIMHRMLDTSFLHIFLMFEAMGYKQETRCRVICLQREKDERKGVERIPVQHRRLSWLNNGCVMAVTLTCRIVSWELQAKIDLESFEQYHLWGGNSSAALLLSAKISAIRTPTLGCTTCVVTSLQITCHV
jgi:hypothetical protein